ncbi:MAG: hypothetical protein D3912_11780, partial [Candidatus Electrothrix sp. AX1]|nr:hypothetical protein [Candidatus Electrothrix sp. AX1]
MFKTKCMKFLSTACFMLIAGVSLTHSAKASVQKLLTEELAGGDQFGVSVSVSGDTAVIGAPFDDNKKGSAYIFVRSPDNVWQLQQKIFAGDGATDDWFGRSVSISGDTVAVSSPFSDFYINGIPEVAGAVYIFIRSGSSWSQQAKLQAADRQPYDQFGSAVSLDGDTVVIGNSTDSENGLQDVGSAYVFVRSGSSWNQQAKLLAADGATDDGLGFSVSVDGETAIVGAKQYSTDSPGKAYVFIRSGSSWSQQAKLLAADGQADDYFGEAVSLDGDTAVIGASGDDDYGLFSGAAYVFTRIAGIWIQQKKLTASDADASSGFGQAVSISGDTILVGAGYEGNNCPGAAYVFTRSGSDWTEQERIVSTDDETFLYQYFGYAVALDGDTAVIGEPGYFSEDSGSAYAFNFACGYSLGRNLPASTWLMTAPSCVPSPTGISDQYGTDLGGTYGTNWISFAWLTGTQKYNQQAADDALTLGVGNWNYSFNAGTLSL